MEELFISYISDTITEENSDDNSKRNNLRTIVVLSWLDTDDAMPNNDPLTNQALIPENGKP